MQTLQKGVDFGVYSPPFGNAIRHFFSPGKGQIVLFTS